MRRRGWGPGNSNRNATARPLRKVSAPFDPHLSDRTPPVESGEQGLDPVCARIFCPRRSLQLYYSEASGAGGGGGGGNRFMRLKLCSSSAKGIGWGLGSLAFVVGCIIGPSRLTSFFFCNAFANSEDRGSQLYNSGEGGSLLGRTPGHGSAWRLCSRVVPHALPQLWW